MIPNKIKNFINTLEKQSLLSGCLSIAITALILTIFEIVFFYMIVAPGVILQMDNGIRTSSKQLAKELEKDDDLSNVLNTAMFDDNTENILHTATEREKELVEKINFYTKATGAVIVGLLLVLVFNLKGRLDRFSGHDASMRTAFWTSGITVSVLIAFQGYFYMFGQKYNYLGSFGNEEFLATIYNAMKI